MPESGGYNAPIPKYDTRANIPSRDFNIHLPAQAVTDPNLVIEIGHLSDPGSGAKIWRHYLINFWVIFFPPAKLNQSVLLRESIILAVILSRHLVIYRLITVLMSLKRRRMGFIDHIICLFIGASTLIGGRMNGGSMFVVVVLRSRCRITDS